MLRNSGRRDEANTEWARVERVFGPLPRQVLVDHLYWDGPMEAAERAGVSASSRSGAFGAAT